MQNAATRLLGRSLDEVQQLASEIIMGQMRVVFASMSIEEINNDREKLIALITKGVEVELHKVGLRMINGKPFGLKPLDDKRGNLKIVFNKQYSHRIPNPAKPEMKIEN